MSGVTDNEKVDDRIFSTDIPDEALEAAALAADSGAYTVAFCTKDAICPA